MFTATFWKDATERVVASAAGGALAGIGVEGSFDLRAVGVGAGIAALVSLCKALVAGTRHPEQESASLIDQPGRHSAPEDTAG